MNTHYLIDLPSVLDNTANPAQQKVLDDALKQLGFIPNMYRAMVNTPELLSSYLSSYQALRSYSGFTPAEQEVIFLAISIDNGCDYCLAAHSTLADKYSGVPKAVLEAIRAKTPINDARLAALFNLTADLNSSRGRPQPKLVETFLEQGFKEQDLLAIILAIAVKVMSNYSNHLFSTELDAMFADYKV